MTGPGGPSDLASHARACLQERYVMALATIGSDGPWAASVYFAADPRGGRLYFLSSPTTRHGRNLAGDARVSAAINEDEHDWQQIRGIQLEGTCTPIGGGREAFRAWRVYLRKYPFVGGLFRSAMRDGSTAAKVARTRMYCVHVSALYYLDNRLGFGTRTLVPELAEPR